MAIPTVKLRNGIKLSTVANTIKFRKNGDNLDATINLTIERGDFEEYTDKTLPDPRFPIESEFDLNKPDIAAEVSDLRIVEKGASAKSNKKFLVLEMRIVRTKRDSFDPFKSKSKKKR